MRGEGVEYGPVFMVSLGESWRRRLAASYERVKESYLGSRAPDVPPEFRSNFVAYRGASEVQFILDKAIPETAKRVLVIGVFGGRDFFFLKTRGVHELHAIDLHPMPGIEHLEVANIEKPLPYPDKFFDAIVINEVLEQLVEDAKALGNLRAVLADDGILFVSVPFLHDREPAHVRVHTRLSVVRLLSCCGFEPKEIVERPGLGFYLPWVNPLNFAASAAALALTGRTLYPVTLPILGTIERWTGARRNPLRRISPFWGGFFVFRKSKESFDYVAQNQRAYGPNGG